MSLQRGDIDHNISTSASSEIQVSVSLKGIRTDQVPSQTTKTGHPGSRMFVLMLHTAGDTLNSMFFSVICCLLSSHSAATFMPGDEGNESHEGNGRCSVYRFPVCSSRMEQ